jgi:hypothetical protein
MNTRVLACVLLAACSNNAEDKSAAGEEDMTIVVEADKSRLLAEEQELKTKGAQMQAEKERLAKERAEITEKLSSLSKKDKKAREQLEAQQSKLEAEENRIRDAAKKAEEEREKLQSEKDALLERITSLTKRGKGGMTIEEREAEVAKREQQLASREAKLGEREQKVTNLEAEAAKVLGDANRLVAELAAGGARVAAMAAAVPAAAPTGKQYSKADAQRIQKQARAKMDTKGILVEDLAPAARALSEQMESAVNTKDFSAAAEYATQLESAVDSIIINQEFVKAKMARLNKAIADQKLDAGRQSKVNALLQELGEAFTDGRYDRANRKANQIAAVLKGG